MSTCVRTCAAFLTAAVLRAAGGEAAEPYESPPAASAATRLGEVVVEADKPSSAASSDEIAATTYAARPHDTLQEVLNNVPGLVVRQHQGGGKAPQYLLRGFNADHGTDFLVSVDGVPVNLPSHAHGQGYSDPNFVIPETIETLQLRKGPYFPELGDFATAGALNLVTREEFPESFVTAEIGQFGRYRSVIGTSSRIGPVRTLLAGQASFSGGPFDNEENLRRYNGFLKLTYEPAPTAKLIASGSLYAADWDASGQIPQREVSAGRLDRFGAIDPSEGGRTEREVIDLDYTSRPTAADEWTAKAWLQRYRLALFSNFTFFQSSVFPVAPGDLAAFPTGFALDPRGDGIAQDDSRLVYGGQARYRRHWSLGDVPAASSLGIQLRFDDIDVALHRQSQRRRYFTISRERVRERAYGAYLAQEVFPTEWLRFEGGLRGDVFTFAARSRLLARQSRRVPARFIPSRPRNTNLRAFPVDGSASDAIVSPKANLVISAVPRSEVYLNFGRGFHSNDARGVIQGGDAAEALVPALGAEVGARTRPHEGLDLAAAVWWLDLDSEIVFCGDCGTIEGNPQNFSAGPASRRWGVDFELRWQFARWLTADFDLAWAHPRFRNGDRIPVAPELFMNGGLTATLPNGLELGLRTKFLDDRPGIEDDSVPARGFLITDLIGRYRWRNLEAEIDVLNLFDFDWQEAVFVDTSCTRREAARAAAAGRACASGNDVHFTPGDPLGVRGRVTVFF
jgi:hypothetical protein